MNKLCVLFGFSLFLISNNVWASGMPERGICAHRGANNSHPENTIAAFKEAIRLGVHMIEFDVQMSADSALVIIHDDTVDRTTNGKGEVADLSLAALKKLDAGSWKGADFKGERIPTLSEVLAIMPVNIWLNIHIKSTEENAASLAKKVAGLIIKNKQWRQAVVACKEEVQSVLKKIDTRIKICNMERRDNSKTYLQETIAINADFIQLKTRSDSLLPELVSELKKNKIRINYYGLGMGQVKSLSGNTLVAPEVKLRQLFEAGVEFPLVDEANKMIEVCRQTGIEPVIPEYDQ